MTDHPGIIIAVLVVLATLGIGIGVFSLRRRAKCRRLCSLAALATGQGRRGEALGLLLVAERSWAFNAHDGGRQSLLGDLADFSRILDELVRLGGDMTDDAPLAQIQQSVLGLRGLLSDSNNFGIDGRMMKREAAASWSRLTGEFNTVRQALRRKMEKMKTDAELATAPNGGSATTPGDSGGTEGPPSVS